MQRSAVDKLYSSQMVVTIYNNENDLTNEKREKTEHTNKWHV